MPEETAPNFANLIGAAVAAKMTTEFIEKEVDARVNKLLVEAIDSALRSYSDVGKLIIAAVGEALKVNELDLPSYGHVVTQMLKAQIEQRVAELVAGRLSQDMEELLSLAPKQVKLSEIAQYMLKEHDDGYGEMITVIVERTEYDNTLLFLDEEKVIEERNKYSATYRLLIGKDGLVASAYIGEADLSKTKHIGRAYGLDQLIRAYVACGTVIIIDEDHVERGKGDY